MKITGLDVRDIRFPTSRGQHGSDAMNVDPDYSAAYVVLTTSGALEGHGLTFTLGRGNGWGTTNADAEALLALSDVLQPPFRNARQGRVELRGPFGVEALEVFGGNCKRFRPVPRVSEKTSQFLFFSVST